MFLVRGSISQHPSSIPSVKDPTPGIQLMVARGNKPFDGIYRNLWNAELGLNG
jgi:hypothetical protein